MKRAVTIEFNKSQANPDNRKEGMFGEKMKKMLSRSTLYICVKKGGHMRMH